MPTKPKASKPAAKKTKAARTIAGEAQPMTMGELAEAKSERAALHHAEGAQHYAGLKARLIAAHVPHAATSERCLEALDVLVSDASFKANGLAPPMAEQREAARARLSTVASGMVFEQLNPRLRVLVKKGLAGEALTFTQIDAAYADIADDTKPAKSVFDPLNGRAETIGAWERVKKGADARTLELLAAQGLDMALAKLQEEELADIKKRGMHDAIHGTYAAGSASLNAAGEILTDEGLIKVARFASARLGREATKQFGVDVVPVDSAGKTNVVIACKPLNGGEHIEGMTDAEERMLAKLEAVARKDFGDAKVAELSGLAMSVRLERLWDLAMSASGDARKASMAMPAVRAEAVDGLDVQARVVLALEALNAGFISWASAISEALAKAFEPMVAVEERKPGRSLEATEAAFEPSTMHAVAYSADTLLREALGFANDHPGKPEGLIYAAECAARKIRELKHAVGIPDDVPHSKQPLAPIAKEAVAQLSMALGYAEDSKRPVTSALSGVVASAVSHIEKMKERIAGLEDIVTAAVKVSLRGHGTPHVVLLAELATLRAAAKTAREALLALVEKGRGDDEAAVVNAALSSAVELEKLIGPGASDFPPAEREKVVAYFEGATAGRVPAPAEVEIEEGSLAITMALPAAIAAGNAALAAELARDDFSDAKEAPALKTSSETVTRPRGEDVRIEVRKRDDEVIAAGEKAIIASIARKTDVEIMGTCKCPLAKRTWNGATGMCATCGLYYEGPVTKSLVKQAERTAVSAEEKKLAAEADARGDARKLNDDDKAAAQKAIDDAKAVPPLGFKLDATGALVPDERERRVVQAALKLAAATGGAEACRRLTAKSIDVRGKPWTPAKLVWAAERATAWEVGELKAAMHKATGDLFGTEPLSLDKVVELPEVTFVLEPLPAKGDLLQKMLDRDNLFVITRVNAKPVVQRVYYTPAKTWSPQLDDAETYADEAAAEKDKPRRTRVISLAKLDLLIHDTNARDASRATAGGTVVEGVANESELTDLVDADTREAEKDDDPVAADPEVKAGNACPKCAGLSFSLVQSAGGWLRKCKSCSSTWKVTA